MSLLRTVCLFSSEVFRRVWDSLARRFENNVFAALL